MFLHSMLHTRADDVRTISPRATLADVVDELVTYNIGSLLVCEESPDGTQKLVGIITERDILRSQAFSGGSLQHTQVSEIMSPKLITASPHDTAATAMRLMTTHCVRHLPLIEDGNLEGIVSIGDIVKAHHDELELENHYMRAFILGESCEMLVHGV